ncbi:MAG: ATP-binding protein [Gammaproteobacteria bacterium]
MQKIERHIKNQLIKRFNASRSVYIFGPRQSGKTTLAQTIFPDLPYVSLEDPDTLEYLETDPRAFLKQFQTAAIIDEPQRSEKLFSYLQGQIDQEKKKFILTSSQNFLAMEAISQSLAGRISILTLLSLTKSEIDGKPPRDTEALDQLFSSSKLKLYPKYPSIDNLWPFILKGGYPELHANPAVIDYWFADYVKTYIERDVRRVINVNDLGLFQRFIKLCAGRTGNILNKASLAADCGISEATCARWISLLEQSGIIMLLKPYHQNFNKRQTKSPKLLFLDSGLCCHLLSIRKPEHLSLHPNMGAILETYVITEIYKYYLNNGLSQEFYYWRDQHGHEMDLILELPNGQILPIEIKAGQTGSNAMCAGTRKWMELAGVEQGVVLYGGEQWQEREGVQIVPINAIL